MAAPRPSASSPPPPEPPPVSDAIALAHRRYWRFNVALIAVLMTIGFVVSFVAPLFAHRLDRVRFAGFRLPFYLGAQGAILVYVALVVVYIVLMQRADRVLLAALDAERAAGEAQPR